MSTFIIVLGSVSVAANIGVCVWAVCNNLPHVFAGSGCLVALLGFQVWRELERRKR